MNAVLSPLPCTLETRFEPLVDGALLDTVVAVEQTAYGHPWSRGNFTDTLKAGYAAQVLLAGDTVLGYFVAMQGFEEVHLLNITVAPAYQRQGWAQVMLEALAIWSRGQGAQWLWLEVRDGNTRARHVYQRHGFGLVGRRKDYYPDTRGAREDALVMSLKLSVDVKV
jgi:ribosomal-protein-alanine N-acetyltransferase